LSSGKNSLRLPKTGASHRLLPVRKLQVAQDQRLTPLVLASLDDWTILQEFVGVTRNNPSSAGRMSRMNSGLQFRREGENCDHALTSLRCRVQKATCLVRVGRFSEAIEYLEGGSKSSNTQLLSAIWTVSRLACELDPRNCEAWYHKALVESAKEQVQDAADSLRTLLAIAPKSRKTKYVNYARVRLEQIKQFQTFPKAPSG